MGCQHFPHTCHIPQPIPVISCDVFPVGYTMPVDPKHEHGIILGLPVTAFAPLGHCQHAIQAEGSLFGLRKHFHLNMNIRHKLDYRSLEQAKLTRLCCTQPGSSASTKRVSQLSNSSAFASSVHWQHAIWPGNFSLVSCNSSICANQGGQIMFMAMQLA